jgi:threonine aldolase
MAKMQTLSDDAARRACDRVLSLDVRPDPAVSLSALADYARRLDLPADNYGDGELAARLEGHICELLGKEAALFLPSGKLAQMMALRILTGRAGCRRVAMHPRAHFEEYEARAYQELHGLTAARWGEYDALPSLAELSDLMAEPLGVVVLEMPLRRIGCRLLPWDDLTGIAAMARDKGVALHLDGARLWESQPFYGRPHADIAGLFDSIYVAFDKGLGGLAGGMLAGPAAFIAEARIWQRRSGGRMLRAFPYLLAALRALDERLPRMPAYHQKARSIAAALKAIPGIRVTPDPPEANAFLVTLDGSPDAARHARLELAQQHRVWLFEEVVSLPVQGLVSFEVTVREGAFALGDAEIQDLVRQLAERMRQP